MFGLLRQIRDKSDSDFAAERKINNELSDIARFENAQNSNNQRGQRHQQRARRELELTTDSDGDHHTRGGSSTSRYSQTSQSATSANSGHDDDQPSHHSLEIKQTNQRMRAHYQPKLPMYSDDELEKAFQSRDKLVDSADMRPVYPFSVFAHNPTIRNGQDTIAPETTRKGKRQQQLEQLQKNNHGVELLDVYGDVITTTKSTTKGQKRNGVDKSIKEVQSTTPLQNGSIPVVDHVTSLIIPSTTPSRHDPSTVAMQGPSPMRFKMAVFKARLKTDKALFQHFSKKVIAHRRKIFAQCQEDKRLLLEQQLAVFYQHKQELIDQLDSSTLGSLLQSNTNSQKLQQIDPELIDSRDTIQYDTLSQENPESDLSAHSQQDMTPGLDEITEEELSNIVTRVEMDTEIDLATLQAQTQCHYCTYRPLHTYSMASNGSNGRLGQGMMFTGESGLAHWNIIPKKWQDEILKGGRFVSDIERVLFAVVLGFPIVPAHSAYVSRNSQNTQQQTARALESLMDIQSYAKFTTKHHLPAQPSYQLPIDKTSPSKMTQSDQSTVPEQIVVKLNTDWFGITPRNPRQLNYYNPPTSAIPTKTTDINGNGEGCQKDFFDFIPTHHGVTLFCKDLYALNVITSLAAFHSCYTTIHQLSQSATTGNSKKTTKTSPSPTTTPTTAEQHKYLYQVEVYFNTGCCLCHKGGEIEYINKTDTDAMTHTLPTPVKTDPDATIITTIDNNSLDSIDTSPTDDDGSLLVGLLVDSFGIKVEQFTYCIPHLKTVADIDTFLDANKNGD